MLKKFTIKNKDISRQEKIRWRVLPNERYIKLYHEEKGYVYLPKWSFEHKLKEASRFFLDEKIEYTWTFSEEQDKVLDIIMWDNRRTALVDLKTWRGKSHIIMWLLDMLQEKTLILCHNKKTVKEMYDKIYEFCGYESWVYYSDKKNIKEITITTHKSFTQKFDMFQEQGFSLLIYDECHLNLSETMRACLFKFKASWLFAFSWTPETQNIGRDDMQIIFGDIIKWEKKNNWYNMIPEITFIEYTNNENFCFESWHDLREQLMYNNKRMNSQLKFIKENDFNYWLLLTERRYEAEKYYEYLKENVDFWVILMHWDTKQKEDEENLQYMRDNYDNFLIIGTAWKLSVWVDIPEIDTVFLFFPCQFKWAVIQACWRCLRNHESKIKTRIYDWVDKPILLGQKYKRQTAYKEEYNKKEIYVVNAS